MAKKSKPARVARRLDAPVGRGIRSITYARRRIQELTHQIKEWRRIAERFHEEQILLAKLAATGPAFFNPLDAARAEEVRNKILDLECKMKPDGTPNPSLTGREGGT